MVQGSLSASWTPAVAAVAATAAGGSQAASMVVETDWARGQAELAAELAWREAHTAVAARQMDPGSMPMHLKELPASEA